MRRVALILCFLARVVTGAPVCESTSHEVVNPLGLGAVLQLLLPSRLPEFLSSTSAVGPLVSIPIGDLALVQSFTYGPSGETSAYFLESTLRVPLKTPFLPWYALAGVQFLHYSAPIKSHNYVGVHIGPALLFNMSKGLDLQLSMKIYFQSDMMTSFSGNLIFAL
jgi:hypothetical protein